ncbi:MAG: EVE domain-containing protein [Nitrospinae bacterium]|nr:EVE domain-containing protein [Nitrospinota bacterium]
MNYWLVKQEPTKYSWEQFEKDKKTRWDGVRNYQARNNLNAMRCGDLLLFYHSVEGKEIRGVAEVCKESYPDPTADDPRWVAVDIKPVRALRAPVPLDAVKAHPRLQKMALIRQSRLSVMQIAKDEFEIILEMGGSRS